MIFPGSAEQSPNPKAKVKSAPPILSTKVPAQPIPAEAAPPRPAALLAWAQTLLPDYFRHPPSRLQAWLCGEFDRWRQRRGTRLNVIGPRGAAKSTIGSLVYPLHCALEGSESLIWIVSETREQAWNHLENMRLELTDNEALRDAYPQLTGAIRWRASRVCLPGGSVIEAFGAGQRIRGRRRRASRPSLIVCDDLQSDAAMHSVRTRQRDWDWFTGMLLKAGTPETNVVNLATALHRDALALRLARLPGWDSHTFAAILRWPDEMSLWEAWAQQYRDLDNPDRRQTALRFFEQHREQMQRGAELLWPERDDLYSLMVMREDEGRAVFEREKQGRPANPDICEWPESYFDSLVYFDDWPADLPVRTLALDPSKGQDARRGDYSAYVLLGVDQHGSVLVEADLARRPTPELVAAVSNAGGLGSYPNSSALSCWAWKPTSSSNCWPTNSRPRCVRPACTAYTPRA